MDDWLDFVLNVLPDLLLIKMLVKVNLIISHLTEQMLVCGFVFTWEDM